MSSRDRFLLAGWVLATQKSKHGALACAHFRKMFPEAKDFTDEVVIGVCKNIHARERF
jgi:hypothetical protein